MTVRNKFGKGSTVSLKISEVALCCGSEITAAIEAGYLNAIGIIGCKDGRGQEAILNHQRQGGCGYYNEL